MIKMNHFWKATKKHTLKFEKSASNWNQELENEKQWKKIENVRSEKTHTQMHLFLCSMGLNGRIGIAVTAEFDALLAANCVKGKRKRECEKRKRRMSRI